MDLSFQIRMGFKKISEQKEYFEYHCHHCKHSMYSKALVIPGVDPHVLVLKAKYLSPAMSMISICYREE